MEGKRGSECLLKSVSNIDFNPAQAQTFSPADYQEYLVEWDDVLTSLRDCSNEFAKENLQMIVEWLTSSLFDN